MNNLYKLLILLLFQLFFTVKSEAQIQNSLRFAPELSTMRHGDYRGGVLGASLSLYVYDYWFEENGHNAFVFTIKKSGFSSPLYDKNTTVADDRRYILHNSFSFLTGYNYFLDGWYVEPRVGYVLSTNKYKAFVFSPQIGYIYNRFDLSLFCDLANAKDKNSIDKLRIAHQNFGISLGVLF